MLKNERIKLLISFSIILFFVVYTLEHSLEVKNINLEKISLKEINKVVKVKAQISKQTIINDNSFIILKNNKSTIQAVFFELNQTLENNKMYTIIGKITPYQNKPQINIIEIY